MRKISNKLLRKYFTLLVPIAIGMTNFMSCASAPKPVLSAAEVRYKKLKRGHLWEDAALLAHQSQ